MDDIAEIEDLFAPFGRVAIKRMFGGLGVYADGVFFAMVNRGEVYLKTDEALVTRLQSAGSRQFTYEHKGRGQVLTSLWTLPPSAHEDDGELVEFSRLALQAARGKAVAKSKTSMKRAARPASKKPAKPSTRGANI